MVICVVICWWIRPYHPRRSRESLSWSCPAMCQNPRADPLGMCRDYRLSCALARCHDISHSPWWSAGSLSQSLRTFRITSCARLSGLGWGRRKPNRDQGMQDYWFYTGSGALQLSRQSERPLPISGPQTFPQKSRPRHKLYRNAMHKPMGPTHVKKEKRKRGKKMQCR